MTDPTNQDHYPQPDSLPPIDQIPEVTDVPKPPAGTRIARLEVWEEPGPDGMVRVRMLAMVPQELQHEVPGQVVMAARSIIAGMLQSAGHAPDEPTITKIRSVGL